LVTRKTSLRRSAAAVAAARRYLSYFGGSRAGTRDAPHGDQRLLRHLIPENRVRSYEVRPVIEALCDTGSVLELRAGFGAGVLTALARIGGHAVGLLASNPLHLGGAIDGDAADKATAFLGRCEAHRLPVVSLVDTPGFMVGPAAERTAIVRRFGAMFVAGARLTVPVCAVVLRKAYGLGAMAMTAVSPRRGCPRASRRSWPVPARGRGLRRSGRRACRACSSVLHRKAQATLDHLFRDIRHRPAGGEGVRAQHQEGLVDRHAGLDHHHAARLVHLHLVGGPAVGVIGERVAVAAAELQDRDRGGVRGRHGRGELAGRQFPGQVTVKIESTDADAPDTQRQRKHGPDPGGRGALHEGRPALDRHVTGLVQIIHHDRHAALDRLDAGALAESELKILNPCGYLVSGADNTPVTRGRHQRDASTSNP
jgi:hypothetical protein